MLILPLSIHSETVHLNVTFDKAKLNVEENYLLSMNKVNYMGDFQVNHERFFGPDLIAREREVLEKQLKLYPERLTDFVRNYMQNLNDSIFVISRNYQEKDFCTKYRVPSPPKKGNISLDKIYGKILNDLRLNVRTKKEDSILSFEEIQLDKMLQQEPKKALQDGVDFLEYFQELQFDTLDKDEEKRVQEEMKKRPKKFVETYQKTASKNSEIYEQIKKLYECIYEIKPDWPNLDEKQKVYIKSNSEKSDKKVA